MFDRKIKAHEAAALHAQAQEMARLLMAVSESLAVPMHEWLEGERAYFRSQAYSDDEARAMAAATYVTVFGAGITRTPPDDPPGEEGLPPGM